MYCGSYNIKNMLGIIILFTSLIKIGVLGSFQTGNLIGYKLHPSTDVHIKLITKLRDSDDGYLFWSGKISLGKTTMILIPLSMKEHFAEVMQNVSMKPELAFDPVTMNLTEIEPLKSRSLALAAIATVVVKKAVEFGTPLLASAAKKIKYEIFGNGRAARSTNIAIYNKLNKKFRLSGENGCNTGIWTSSMLPEFEIPKKRCVIYGAESHGFLTGCTGCRLKYESTDKSKATFAVITSNPFAGSNHVEVEEKKGLYVTTVNGGGNNNIVHVILHK